MWNNFAIVLASQFLGLGAGEASIGAHLPENAVETAAKCAGGAYETLSFWTGDWDVHWKRSDGTSGTGISKVTRELDGCVVRERFDDLKVGFSGMSQSSLNPYSMQWMMVWGDNKGQPFLARGAAQRAANSDYIFNLEGGGGRSFRILFEGIRPDGFTWRFQTAVQQNEPWTDLTVSEYHRKR